MPIKHNTVGSELTQEEFEDVALHAIDLAGLLYGFRKGATDNRRYSYNISALALGTAGVGAQANFLRVFPFIPPATIDIDRICCWVSTLLAGDNVKLCIYEDGDNLYPGALVVDSGAIDTSTTGMKEVTINAQLTGGKLYWMGYVLNTITTLAFRKFAVGARLPILGLSAAATPQHGIGWTVGHTFANNLPSTYPGGGTIIAASNDLIVAVRVV